MSKTDTTKTRWLYLKMAATGRYKVAKLKNSTTPKVGSYLSQDEADNYCRDAGWEVVVQD